MTRDDAVHAVIEAVTNEGPQPTYHRAQLERLRHEWPTLWQALHALIGIEKTRA